ncbi:(d)CMP kinase [Bacillaceae bacterium S4-13-58]
MKKIAIAIDGPAAAGKSTVAKLLARELHYTYIDTGAMYRALTKKAMDEKVDLEDEKKLTDVLKNTTIELVHGENNQLVFVDGTDVSEEIRNPTISNSVSIVAQHENVRKEMVKRQKALAEKRGVVMDGRDIGTHVIPNAEVKIFLIASVEERAERRYKEDIQKGYQVNLEIIQKEIRERDRFDSQRKIAPLTKAEDAVEVDTTSKSIEEVKDEILNIVKSKLV